MPTTLRSLQFALAIASISLVAVMAASIARQALVGGNAAYTEVSLKNLISVLTPGSTTTVGR